MNKTELRDSRSAGSASPADQQRGTARDGLGVNEGLVESMRERFLRDPRSISLEWAEYFAKLGVTPRGEPLIPLDQLSAAWAEASGVLGTADPSRAGGRRSPLWRPPPRPARRGARHRRRLMRITIGSFGSTCSR